MANDGGAAFPVNSQGSVIAPGMSLRDYLAAHAPDSERDNFDNNNPNDKVGWRWRYANAMLRAREEKW